MSDNPTRTNSKSQQQRSDPDPGSWSNRVSDRHGPIESGIEVNPDAGCMLPPPPPSGHAASSHDKPLNERPIPHNVSTSQLPSRRRTESFGPVDESFPRFTHHGQSAMYSPVPTSPKLRSTAFDKDPLGRPETPTPANPGPQAPIPDSNKVKTPRGNLINRACFTGPGPIPPSPSRLESRMRQPLVNLFRNDERKKRRRDQRGILAPSPIMNVPSFELGDWNEESAAQNVVHREHDSKVTNRIQLVQKRAYRGAVNDTTSPNQSAILQFGRENQGRSPSNLPKASIMLSHMEFDGQAYAGADEARDGAGEALGGSGEKHRRLNVHKVAETTGYRSESTERLPSQENYEWEDLEADVDFRDNAQEAEFKSNQDSYPELTAGLDLTAGLQAASTSSLLETHTGEISIEDWIEGGHRIMENLNKQVRDAIEIGKRRVQQMNNLNEIIDERHRLLAIRQQDLQKRKENLARGVRDTICASELRSKR